MGVKEGVVCSDTFSLVTSFSLHFVLALAGFLEVSEVARKVLAWASWASSGALGAVTT